MFLLVQFHVFCDIFKNCWTIKISFIAIVDFNLQSVSSSNNCAPSLIEIFNETSIFSIAEAFTNGPKSVSSSNGSPTLNFSIFCTNFSINSFAIFFTTIKRLDAIQL